MSARLDHELSLALDLARSCGALALSYQTGGLLATREKANDEGPVTRADLECNARIVQALREAFPGDDVIAEESEPVSVGRARCWYIDPIDGTANFARQIPHFCISLGRMVDGQMEAGAIYEPMHDELYIAQRGQGAWLNGKPMRVSAISDLKASTVEVGWSTRIPVDTYLAMAGRAAHAGCSVRRAGSGSLGLAYVAAGRTEGYAEPHINSWDVAAGLLLVTEAGGRVNDFWGQDGLRIGNPVLVTNAALADAFSALTGIALRD